MTRLNVAKALRSALQAGFSGVPIVYNPTATWDPPATGEGLFLLSFGDRKQTASPALREEPVVLTIDLRVPATGLKRPLEHAEAIAALFDGRELPAPAGDKGHLYCHATRTDLVGPVAKALYRTDVVMSFTHYTA